jgi:hypothetical protein
MSLFMWSAFWMPALATSIAGVALLFFGHWVVGPLLTLLGGFLVGAFWSFPRDVWVARPCDLELSSEGFRVLGGYRAGATMSWDTLDAAASGLRQGESLLSSELVAVARSGELMPLAEGEEHDAFVAALDAFRASDGLPPVPPRLARGHYEALQLRDSKARDQRDKRRPRKGEEPKDAPRVVVDILHCKNCGAPACPVDAPHATCRYCQGEVRMPDPLRHRVREMMKSAALRERSKRALERLLRQSSAPITMALLGALTVLMLASWLLGAASVVLSVPRGSLGLRLVLTSLAAPLSCAVALSILASVVASRRVAVSAVAVDFAAVAPERPEDPFGCRVCGAPLPEREEPVVRCAYCASESVLRSARPRAPSRVKEQADRLEESLSSQRTEQQVRQIFFALVGLPALFGAYLAAVALVRHIAG